MLLPACSDGPATKPHTIARDLRAVLEYQAGTTVHIQVTVRQALQKSGPARLVAAGSGVVGYATSTSSMTFRLSGGGSTDFLQADDNLYLRSYNNARQRQETQWSSLPASKFHGMLRWPPTAFVDPTFLFASGSLMRATANALAMQRAFRPIRTDADGEDVYQVVLAGRAFQPPRQLLSFSDQQMLDRPTMTIWSRPRSGIARMHVYWPAVSSVETGSQSSRPSGGNDEGFIEVSAEFSTFSGHLSVEPPKSARLN